MIKNSVFLFYITLICILLGSVITENVWIRTKNGILKGRVENTVTGTTFHTFSGIPFAEPPVGDLRFQAPVSKNPWTGEWDATSEKGCCYQMTMDRPDETEDCLYLNVYTPKTDSSANYTLPVMVFIYGGAFISGCAEEVDFGPNHLIDQGVIFVTFNYRIGPFGFFSTGDDVVPGNAGLKDQNLALQWIQENIHHFGGDPSKVTIFGESAGGASVVYQMLSPKSKGLFRAAMSESATAISPWAYQHHIKDISYYLATLLNSNFSKKHANSSEVLDYLTKASAKDIDNASFDIYLMDSAYNSQIQQGCFFAPTLEHEHEGAFITESMYESLKNGKFNRVPFVMGVNSEESLGMADNKTAWEIFTSAFDENHKLLVPQDLHIISEIRKAEVSELIKNFYAKNTTFSSNPLKLVKYFTDQCFARSIIKHVILQSNYTDVYAYRFAYHGVLGLRTNTSVYGFSDSVTHGEDIDYYLTRGYGGLNTTDLTKYPAMDQIVAKRVITFFTNFAKYLNPTPGKFDLFQNLTWPTVKPEDFQYMDIGSYLEVKKDLKKQAYQFWEKIYKKYSIKPLITY